MCFEGTIDTVIGRMFLAMCYQLFVVYKFVSVRLKKWVLINYKDHIGLFNFSGTLDD